MIRGIIGRGRVKILRFFLIFIIVMFVFSMLPTTSAAEMDDQSSKTRQDDWRAQVTIQIFDEDKQDAIQEVRVGPGDLRSAVFKGTVAMSITGAPGKHFEQIWVLLYADIEDPNWNVQIIPPVVSFPYRDGIDVWEEVITVQVMAPFRAPVATHDIMVTGLWTATPTGFSGQAYSNRIQVTVVQFPDLLLDSLDVLVETGPGQTVNFKMQIHNRGNDYDDFSIELINVDSLSNAGWAIIVNETTISDIPSWGFKNITIQVKSPQGLTIWKNQVTEIIISVQSETSKGSIYENIGKKEFSFFFYERGTYIPPEPTICLISGIIILIIVVTWYRKRTYKKWIEEKEAEEGEEEDEEDDDT